MARNVFYSEKELLSQPGLITVIKTDTCSVGSIPDGLIIEDYEDGYPVPNTERYYETSDISDKILNDKMQENVFFDPNAEGVYDTMCELAQEFRDCNCNLDVYGEHLEQKLFGECDPDEEDDD